MGERRVAARAMCVWLGTLASWRPGLIGELVREFWTAAGVLEQPPEEIVKVACRRPRRGARAAGAHAGDRPQTGGTADERASDAARFRAVLTQGPQECLRWAEQRPPGHLVVAWTEALYPDQLRDLPDPPLCLFVRGGSGSVRVQTRLSALADLPLVAVVGTRSPSPYGEEMARVVGGGLSGRGVVVVSGLALGVDAAAQAAAVEGRFAPDPATVAVLGCGADVIYPRRNGRLYRRIVERGLILSEFAWGVPARAWRFPARNRVMAALGRGVVLVEGTDRSGAKITVSHAADIGRDVLCVPGEAGRRLSEAPNRLLDAGARLCESAGDVLEVIGIDDRGPGLDGAVGEGAGGEAGATTGPRPVLILDHGAGAVRDVLQALQDASLTIDQLAVRCELPAPKVAVAVGDLEVEGLACRLEGGRYRLTQR